jgi:hypothetical protein
MRPRSNRCAAAYAVTAADSGQRFGTGALKNHVCAHGVGVSVTVGLTLGVGVVDGVSLGVAVRGMGRRVFVGGMGVSLDVGVVGGANVPVGVPLLVTVTVAVRVAAI